MKLTPALTSSILADQSGWSSTSHSRCILMLATHLNGSQWSQDAASRSRHNTLVPETTVDLDQFCAECGITCTLSKTPMTLGGSKLAPQPSGRCWTASSSTDMDPYIDPYAQGRARFIRPCILPHTRMSHLQLAPGAASWWEMAGESAMDNGVT